MQLAKEVVASGDWSGEPADAVVLEFDERYRQHAAFSGVGGLAFTLELPEPTMLRHGDGLKLEDGRIVEVVAAPEPLMEIRSADPLTLIRIALRLGNYHAPAEATAKTLRVRRDSEIEDIAKSLGARVTPLEAPFNPEGAAYVMAEAAAHDGHHDHHDHGHRHGHNHEEHDHGHHGHAHSHPGHDEAQGLHVHHENDHAHGDHSDEPDAGHSSHDHESAVRRHRGEEDVDPSK